MTSGYLLKPDEIKVWYVRPEDFSDPAQLKVFTSWLSPAEHSVLNSFRLESLRHTYLVAHALLRGALSQITLISPSLLDFHTNAYNKPFLTSPAGQNALHFNLSHTEGLAAIGITRLGSIGIDVEHDKHNFSVSELAPEILTQAEYLDYLNQPHEKQQQRLLRYWTLKEAYIKSIGLGLSAGLKTYEFDLEATPQPTIHFLSQITPDAPTHHPSHWKFWQKILPTDHTLAVGICETSGVECQISVEQDTWLENFHESG